MRPVAAFNNLTSRKEWAERAEIRLNTHTIDGKMDPLTRLHHVIPVAEHMQDSPAEAAKPHAAPPTDRTGGF